MQKGPWKIDKDRTIVDASGDIIRLNGIAMPSARVDKNDPAHSNKELVQKAPELNHVVGKLLDIMSNPYSNNDHRMDKIYILTEELRNAYVNGADYEE